ncbi:MAG TPA: acyltransferase [Devosia sp.]|nr:acyltransferase [Devosia sp.]
MVSERLSYIPPGSWKAEYGHVPSLDGLRAFSIGTVLIGHMVLPASLIGVSAFGVKVFFFISGLLITRLLFAEHRKNGSINLRDFYIRRVLRLYPVLIALVGSVLLIATIRGLAYQPIDVASVFFYFVNYLLVQREFLGADLSLPFGVLWSLSVEEHFYIFVPLTFFLVRATPRRLLTLAIALCCLSLGLRLAYTQIWPGIEHTLLIYRHSETRFDSIAFGVILACLCEMPAGRRLMEQLASRWAFLLGIVVLLGSFLIRDDYFQNTWRFTIQGLSLFPIFVGLVFAAPFPLFNKMLNIRPMAWVGKLSYSLYIWHGTVVFFFGWWVLSLPKPVIGLTEIIITFSLAVASYYIVERPTLKLRKYFRGGESVQKPVSGFAANIETSP